VIWQRLDKALREQGLTLRTYPSSAPSSTVGGWLAQGGVGFGAFEFGAFRESVVSCRVVLPSGEAREFSGADLDLISDAEGITGFITEVTLKVRLAEPEALWGILFKSADALAGALNAIRQAKLPIWSVSFINPKMGELKNQLPPRMEHGHPVHEHRPTVPQGYIAILAAPESRRAAIDAQLPSLATASGGQMLDAELVQHEWDERFDLMHVKRLGPSIAPAEVLAPLSNLGAVLKEIEARVSLPMVMEGMVSGNGEVTILGFILHDERKFTFNFAFGLALTVLRIAKENGGRAYSTGLYFANEAKNVLGAERLKRLGDFKTKVDPKGAVQPRQGAQGQVRAVGVHERGGGLRAGCAVLWQPLCVARRRAHGGPGPPGHS
jgi:FAD/FMN-containing dehydrogenase